MKQTRNHFAVVIDEYGGMTGIVTINDLLEQLVGDLEDEVQPEEEAEKLEKLDSNTWRISGGIPLDQVSQELGVDLPTEEYDTFGGFVFGSYGSIPRDGRKF